MLPSGRAGLLKADASVVVVVGFQKTLSCECCEVLCLLFQLLYSPTPTVLLSSCMLELPKFHSETRICIHLVQKQSVWLHAGFKGRSSRRTNLSCVVSASRSYQKSPRLRQTRDESLVSHVSKIGGTKDFSPWLALKQMRCFQASQPEVFPFRWQLCNQWVSVLPGSWETK